VHFQAAKLVCCLLLAISVSCGGAGSSASSSSAGVTDPSALPPVGPPIDPIPIVPGQPVHVLFVGNSLTQANNLPLMVTALAAGVGVTVQATDASQGGFSLEDHWNDQRAPRAIDQGGWHFVVMQQGPSALPESQTNLRFWAGKFNERIRAVGGRPAMCMIWPEAARIDQFENVRLSYLHATQDIDGVFMGAGDAWREAWKQDASLAFYGPDDFHPSRLGTYAAALVIASKITSHAATEMPSDFTLAGGAHIVIDPAQAAIVKAAAAQVVSSE